MDAYLFDGMAEEYIVLTQLSRRVGYVLDESAEIDIVCTWLGPTSNIRIMVKSAQLNNACPCFGHRVTIHLSNIWAET